MIVENKISRVQKGQSAPLAFSAGATFLLLALLPFVLRPGLANSYDWALQVAWLERFYLQLSEGTYWPQWLADSNDGRGAPVFAFYPPIGFYLGSFWRWALGNSPQALKFAEGSVILMTYVTSFAFFHYARLGPFRSTCFALLCAFSPALLFLSFRAHMLGASLSLVWLPIVLASSLADSGRMRGLLLAGGLALIAWTHLPSLLIATCVSVLMAALQTGLSTPAKRLSSLYSWAWGSALGIAIGAAPLAAPLFENSLISLSQLTQGQMRWDLNFLSLFPPQTAPFRADYAFLAGAGIASALIAVTCFFPFDARARSLPLAMSALLVLLMTTSLSAVLYQRLWPLQSLQFPWRWLPWGTALALSALALRPPRRSPHCVASAVTAAIWLIAYAAAFGYAGNLLSARTLTTAEDERWAVSMMPRDAPEYIPSNDGPLFASTRERLLPWTSDVHGAAPLEMTPRQVGGSFGVRMPRDGMVLLRTACFPGWTVSDNGAPAILQCTSTGELAVELAPGIHELHLRFGLSEAREWGRWISLGAVAVWLCLLFAARTRPPQGRPGPVFRTAPTNWLNVSK